MSARPEEISIADLANLARAAGFTPVRGAMEGADWIGDTAALRLLVSNARAVADTEAALRYLVECLRDEDEGQSSCSKLVRYAFEGYEKALAAAK